MDMELRELIPTELLDYEIRSSWWTSHIGWGPLQRLAGTYFAWKVNRKYHRYRKSLREAARIKQYWAGAGVAERQTLGT